MEIRRATEDDENFLREVYFSTRIEKFSALGWNAEQLGHFLAMQYDFQKQSFSSNLILLWVNNSRLLAISFYLILKLNFFSLFSRNKVLSPLRFEI